MTGPEQRDICQSVCRLWGGCGRGNKETRQNAAVKFVKNKILILLGPYQRLYNMYLQYFGFAETVGALVIVPIVVLPVCIP